MTKYSRFCKGDKRDRENSPNNKFPSKTMDTGVDGEGTSKENKGEENKGKNQHITTITKGVSRANI